MEKEDTQETLTNSLQDQNHLEEERRKVLITDQMQIIQNLDSNQTDDHLRHDLTHLDLHTKEEKVTHPKKMNHLEDEDMEEDLDNYFLRRILSLY